MAAKLLTTLSVIIAVMVQPGSSQIQPPQPTECWSALTGVPSCVAELYMALFNGQLGVVGPACCGAISKVNEQCWARMFPFSPMFPPMLRNFCSAPAPPSSTPMPQDDTMKCWAPFGGVNGCVWDIYRSLFSAPRVSIADPGCCKVVRDTDATCWPKMFPANPLFPVLLKTTCASGAPPPQA